jgi:hypothetical protein
VDFATQEQRGQAYASFVQRLLDLRAADGVYPVVGLDWWAWSDKTTGGERHNFGLVSGRDNAYDGKEAIPGTGVDRWGFRTGGERRKYGDFIGSVVAAHGSVARVLSGQIGAGSARSEGTRRPGSAVARTVEATATSSPVDYQ